MPVHALPGSDHPTPTLEQLWEQDRALLEQYGPSHIESICVVAAGLRAEGEEQEAAELDRQCARMRILVMEDTELLALYRRKGDDQGDALFGLVAYEARRRGIVTQP